MTAVVSADNLVKWYGPRLAVDRVSFDVQQGEVVGLLGPNGSGKSTVLRIISGYLKPSSGTASIAGHDVVTDSLEARRLVGYVPEDVPLYTHMRVREFLDFMGRLRGVSGRELRGAVDRAIERLRLEKVVALGIGKLSRGYRQRVAIAQAILARPALLILDEPTNGLDPRQIIDLRSLIGTLAEEHAILITSHVLAEIERTADRAVILLDGRPLGSHAIGGERDAWTLRVRGEPTEVRATLLACADVAAADHHAATDTWLVRVRAAGAQERVAAAITAAGHGLLELRPAASGLEELFLRITGTP